MPNPLMWHGFDWVARLLLNIRREIQNIYQEVIQVSALTLQAAGNYTARNKYELPPQIKTVKLSVVSKEVSILEVVKAGIALGDRKFRAASEQPNKLLWWAGLSILFHLSLVWSVTHKQAADLIAVAPEIVVQIAHSEPERPQVQPKPIVQPEPPRVVPLPDDVVIPAPVQQVVQPPPVDAPTETVTEPSASAAHLNNPKPDYPELAERMRWEGTVVLHVHVMANGRPDVVEVRQSSGRSVLDQAAVKTVKARYSFVPAKRGAAPIEGWVTFPIEFKLAR
jgi:TonB family protein